MRQLLIVLLLLFPAQGFAQDVNEHGVIAPGYYVSYSHRPSDRYKHIVFKVDVPAWSIAFVGFKRVSGSGDHDIRIGTGVSAESFDRARITGVVAANESDDSAPDVLMFGPGPADRFYIEAWAHTNDPGQWKIAYQVLSLPEAGTKALVQAGAIAGLECLFVGCNYDAAAMDRNFGRAMTLGLSLLSRRNVCAVGSDLVINELMTEFQQETQAGTFVTAAVGSLFSDIVAAGFDVSC